MFDATKGKKKVNDQIDENTDEVAALFDDLKPRKRLAVSAKLKEVLADEVAVEAFLAGDQPSNPQPAQLGAGQGGQSPTPQPAVTNETEALDILVQSPNISNGVKAALRRLLNPRDPQPLLVEADGTPTAVRDAERERNNQKTRADTADQAKVDAEQKLNEERDPAKVGSLANKLAAAQAAAAVPADMMPKANAKVLLEGIKTDVGALKAPANVKISGKKELLDKLQHEIDGL